MGFKRALTKLTSWTSSTSEQQERNLRHAAYKFDRHVNRLVEDLANNPDLSPKDVSQRLNKIAVQAEKIQAASLYTTGASENSAALAKRFSKNLNESLQALAKHNVTNLDQPVKFTKPPVASITHAPASKNEV
ncbi:MAG: hypothetical protein KDJ99_06475 [Candidatus Competibacteraceae bacterium]|nr:hypothetical protein [Candidatus Competibacteraceae bacterium]